MKRDAGHPIAGSRRRVGADAVRRSTRRKILLALGAGALAPFASFAQQPGRIWRVGFLYFGSRKAALDNGRLAAFTQEMHKLGYVHGKNLVLEERYADSTVERVAALAAELVQGKPDVIVATGGPSNMALRNATREIPIVVTVTVDPVRAGYAATMARPGGNFTGLTDTASFLGPKHLELLVTVAPRASRVAVLLNPSNPDHRAQLALLTPAAQKIGRQLVPIEAGNPKEMEAGFAAMARERANALVILSDTFFTDHTREIAALARRSRLPSISALPDFAVAGGLLSYGSDLLHNFRRAAVFVDKILKGANPKDLPFEQPTQYELLINLKTAKALGISIPQSLLLRADRVIE